MGPNLMAKDILTAVKVRALKEPGRYADGAGLYLHIDKNGNKRWIFRFTLDGKTSERGLGSAEVYSLAQARERALDQRQLAKSGVNPVREAKVVKEERRTESPTFGKVADDFLETKIKEFKNDKHIAQWRSTLKNHCSVIRNTPVDEIRVEHVLKVLKPIWYDTPETASRLRGRIEMILDAARVRGFIEETVPNPARWKGNLALLLPAQRAIDKGHHSALPYEKLPEFMVKLREVNSISSLALEFTILTASRTGEVIGATWPELDLKKRVWTIPDRRMKAGKEHRVPLSDRAIEILEGMKAGKMNDYVFPGRVDGLSNMSMDAVLRRMGLKTVATVHGFRSTFRDWCGDETHFPREVVEAALAHALKDKTEAAYRRKDALEKRRELMTAWEIFCLSSMES